MNKEKSSPETKQESKDNNRDSFFEFYGISQEEQEFFKMIYRRRQIYRLIILGLIIVIAVLLGLR